SLRDTDGKLGERTCRGGRRLGTRAISARSGDLRRIERRPTPNRRLAGKKTDKSFQIVRYFPCGQVFTKRRPDSAVSLFGNLVDGNSVRGNDAPAVAATERAS